MATGADTSLARLTLDAIPCWVFVVDADMRVIDLNRAAAELLDQDHPVVLRRRSGEALACVNHLATVEGCGSGERCTICPLRRPVREALTSGQPSRGRGQFDLVRDGAVNSLQLLVTATPLEWAGQPAAVLLLEDVSLVTDLAKLLPVCMRCRKVRDDNQYWVGVDEFLKRNLDIDLSHGYCPECTAIELAEVQRQIEELRIEHP